MTAYDLLVKNGRIIDGTGMPAFHGDVAVKDGKIVELGKLSGSATRVINADGLVVAPGFVDNHCHYDAQVTWDPLCSFSCYHGATTVVIGNCSLSLAPVRPGTQERASEFLSRVEAIPMEVLRSVEFTWETTAEYMDVLEQHIGVNVGTLIGHSAIRYYVMGDECQGREACDGEIREMQRLVRDGIQAGALGLSISKNKGHFDPQGVLVPAVWATEEEIFALGDVLKELGTGIIQGGGGRNAELENRLMSRLSRATGRQVLYNNLNLSSRNTNGWKDLMDIVEETSKAGVRAYPLCSPYNIAESDADVEAMRQILNFSSAIVGLSDGGAHVQLHGGYGYSTRLLGYWVREMEIMSLEKAVRRLTFESASAFGIYDRGVLHPGMAADITIFDPETVRTLPEEKVYDFPAGGWRIGELAEGINATIVNGEVLLEDGKHTGALPGLVMRNSLYNSKLYQPKMRATRIKREV